MLGESCAFLQLEGRGVVGDRLFALRDAEGKLGSGKTTRRFRRIDGLFDFRARLREGEPEIAFPDGRVMPASHPDIDRALSDVVGLPVTLAREGVTSHLDAGAIHLLTTASLAWLGQALPGVQADERRFRPNIVIDAVGSLPLEREWADATLCIGADVRLRVSERTERCTMVDFSQDDLRHEPELLRFLARQAEATFGVYAVVLSGGSIRCGDAITSADL